jgi:hypothetical protein
MEEQRRVQEVEIGQNTNSEGNQLNPGTSGIKLLSIIS